MSDQDYRFAGSDSGWNWMNSKGPRFNSSAVLYARWS